MSKAPYGYCPKCGSPGISRTRCKSCASDTCENGHQYMAKDAIMNKFKEWIKNNKK